MSERDRHYWAFCANPKYYRIAEAVRDLQIDSWTVPRGDVRTGDRAVIWKAKGNEAERGIIALGEVLTDPTFGLDPSHDYWVDTTATDEPRRRVLVRYLVPAGFPLWEGGPATPIMADLSVGHATGGSVFKVTAGQWDHLMDYIGGWPAAANEVEAALDVVAERVGERPSGQGFRSDPAMRRAVEEYAMLKARRHYEVQGWRVEDVSNRYPYDLHCTRPDGDELHVEVKGTTSDGATVLLTRNEVEHARMHYPRVALFIAAQLQVSTAPLAITGGRVLIREPWKVQDDCLRPLAYVYAVQC
jgi:uncharacterized protein DUF3883/EVE domain-containing protein